jgi:hypothetical protein
LRVTKKPGASKALGHFAKALDKQEAKVGWFPSAVYESGEPVAGVAYVQEFGSPKHAIPARSFMRTTQSEKKDEWKKTLTGLSKAATIGTLAADKVLPALAMAAEGHVRATITKITSPPLKASTVAARKRRRANGGKGAKASIAKPLVDTGIMLNTLTSQVKRK